MKTKFLYLFILIMSFSFSTKVLASPYPYGSAVYREGGSVNVWDHAGLMKNYTWVYEIRGYEIMTTDDTVDEFSKSSFKGNYTYYGTFAPQNLSHSKRDGIVYIAEALDNDPEITYTGFAQVDHGPWGIGDYLSVDEITDIRCDGVVEYAYEANGVPVWGPTSDKTPTGTPITHWDITNNWDGLSEHQKLPDRYSPWSIVSPMVQRGGALVDNPERYTSFRIQNGWDKDPDTGNWYYIDSSTESTYKSWLKYNSSWYYMDVSTGIMRKGWVQVNNLWYYLDENSGIMKTGWQKLNNYWYYFNSSGAMVTGWLNDGGQWYYLNDFSSSVPKGSILTGWQKLNNYWYYFNLSGAMVTGWLNDGGQWYYLNDFSSSVPKGSILTGWQTINNKRYYFYSNGKMACNTVIDGHTIGSDGVALN